MKFMLSLESIDRGKPDELMLPKVLPVMEEEFGKSSKYIDDWKQTFSFPFFRHVGASHVIYGYWDGKFVEEVIENETKYLRAVKKLETKYGYSGVGGRKNGGGTGD